MKEQDHDQNRGHLDLLRIDALRAGEGTEEERAHLEECALCRGYVNRLHTLASSLCRQVPPAEPVPVRVDEAIFDEYRRRFAPAGKAVAFPAWRRWLAPAMGSAAAAALVMALVLPQMKSGKVDTDGLRAPETVKPRAVETGLQSSSGDMNGDGTVDILDAFRLAKLIEARDPGAAGPDMNNDGEVNRLDVDAIARRAVAL